MSVQSFLKLSITSWFERVGVKTTALNDEGGPSGPPSRQAAMRPWFLAIAPLREGTDEARRIAGQPDRACARPRVTGHLNFGVG